MYGKITDCTEKYSRGRFARVFSLAGFSEHQNDYSWDLFYGEYKDWEEADMRAVVRLTRSGTLLCNCRRENPDASEDSPCGHIERARGVLRLEDYERWAKATINILRIASGVAMRREEENIKMRLGKDGKDITERANKLWKVADFCWQAKTSMNGESFFPTLDCKNKPTVHTMKIERLTNYETKESWLALKSRIMSYSLSSFSPFKAIPIDKIDHNMEALRLIATNIDQLIKTFARYTVDIMDLVDKHRAGWPVSVEDAQKYFCGSENDFKLWFHIEAQRHYDAAVRSGIKDTLMQDNYAFDIRPPASEDPEVVTEQLKELYGELFGDDFYAECMQDYLASFASPSA